MKFKYEIELDWIDEGGNIDQGIKEEIIQKTANEVFQSLVGIRAECVKVVQETAYQELKVQVQQVLKSP